MTEYRLEEVLQLALGFGFRFERGFGFDTVDGYSLDDSSSLGGGSDYGMVIELGWSREYIRGRDGNKIQ